MKNQRLSDANQFLKDEMINIFDKLTDPVIREKIFYLEDVLIGGKSLITSGGGASTDSDFPWDGRRPEDEEPYK